MIKHFSLVCLLALLTACGSDGSDSAATNNTPVTPPAPAPVTPEIFTGQFIDSAVEGLNYQTQTQSGTTNAQGEFSFSANETVTFSIGAITFPTVDATLIITPLSLFTTEDVNDLMVINTLRMLQSLDEDADPTNGIKIPSIVHELAANLTLDFSSDEFAAQVEALLTASSAMNLSLISIDDALYHFQQTLADMNQQSNSSCEKTHNMVGWNGYFSTLAHNVSGKATIIDDCTIQLSEFYYDGGGPEVYVYAAKNHNYSGIGAFSISSRISNTMYSNNSLTLKLPAGKTLDDLTGLSIWCVDFAANFGQLEFTP